MAITFDPSKDARNRAKHGIGLARFSDITETTAIMSPRHGEARQLVFGMIDGHLHGAVTLPRGADTHVISLRRASRRERKVYADAQKTAGPR